MKRCVTLFIFDGFDVHNDMPRFFTVTRVAQSESCQYIHTHPREEEKKERTAADGAKDRSSYVATFKNRFTIMKHGQMNTGG